MYINGHHYRNRLYHDLHEVLCGEADKRKQQSPEEWVLGERAAMWEAVNQYRTQLGKKPLTIEDVERVEQSAVGHSDYGTKYALYCTELVENTA